MLKSLTKIGRIFTPLGEITIHEFSIPLSAIHRSLMEFACTTIIRALSFIYLFIFYLSHIGHQRLIVSRGTPNPNCVQYIVEKQLIPSNATPIVQIFSSFPPPKKKEEKTLLNQKGEKKMTN